MKIGIDVSQIAFSHTGVARFTQGLIDSILTFGGNHNWTFFYSSLRIPFDIKLKKKVLESSHTLIEYKLPPTVMSLLWNKLHIIPIEHFVGDLNFFITSDWTEPPSNIRKATIVHDLAFMRYPKAIHPAILKTQKQRMHWVTQESSLIFADSQTTKDDLISFFNLNKKRVHVLYPGLKTASILATQDIEQTLKRYRLKSPFILSVGKIEPRKNISNLLLAYQKLARQKNMPDLILVGQQGWDPIGNTELAHQKGVRFLGQIPDQDLSCLYASCLFFIFPSLWEGFGYPILEAMQHNAPVATSNKSSMSEIAQDSAVFFDPLSPDSIAETMKSLVQDENLRRNLQKKGTIRAAEFSWKRYIEQMILLLETV